MQKKRSRKAAREVGFLLNSDGEKPDKEEEKFISKHGRSIPKNQRSLTAVSRVINARLQKDYTNLPSKISPFQFMVVDKIKDIAFRSNEDKKQIKCPECEYEFEVDVLNVKQEKNSLDALNSLADRMFPKLGHLTQEVNVVGQVNMVAEELGKIIIKHVPADKRLLALGEIREFIERVNGEQSTPTEDNSDRVVSIING